MKLSETNPYVRMAQIQSAVLEGQGPRKAYDHRLFYVLEGKGEVIISGQVNPVRGETLIFIPPAVGYRFQGKMRTVVLNFDMTRVAAHRQTAICPVPEAVFAPETIFDSALTEHFEESFLWSGSEGLRERLLALVREWSEKNAESDAASSAALKGLLVEILREKTADKDPERSLCRRIEGYIRLHAAEIRSNAMLGERFGYHPVYLGELFRRKTGHTLHETILAERIALAKRWLLQTEIGIEEIAFDVGFSSRAHFCTAFRKATGMTPLAYRKTM